ncbi:MAG: hypothetical protein KJO07_00460, partial [Deltaproteobacteria bacterium]|nr:hypothetical protein [Deltaproteobacteria bacterium]
MIARKLAILAAVYLGCTTAPELSVCSNGRVCPAETVCVDALDSCIGDDEFTSCRNRDGEVCQKEGDLGICQDGACSMSCGDELVQLGQGEECESAEGLDCGAFGFYEGTVSCTSCAVDTSTCSGFCGDGLING